MEKEIEEKLRVELEKLVEVRPATLSQGAWVYVGITPVWHGAEQTAGDVATCLRNRIAEAVRAVREEHKSW